MRSKGVSKVFLTFFILSLCTLSVSAAITKVKISTYADHDLEVSFLKPESFVQLDILKENSGPSGEVVYEFSTIEDYFDMNVFVKENNTVVLHERFDANEAGVPIHLILIQGATQIIRNYENVEAQTTDSEDQETEVYVEENQTEENITEENTTVTQEDTTADSSPGITGLATSDESAKPKSFFDNIFYYIIGLLVLSGIVFLGVSRMKKHSGTKEIKVKKLSDIKKDKKQKIDDYKQAIDDAEKKIEEAQKEIKRLKNVDRISEVKKRLIEDQKELMKLRSGDDD